VVAKRPAEPGQSGQQLASCGRVRGRTSMSGGAGAATIESREVRRENALGRVEHCYPVLAPPAPYVLARLTRVDPIAHVAAREKADVEAGRESTEPS